MRLKNIYKTLRDNIEIISSTKAAKINSAEYVIKNWETFLGVMENIGVITVFSKDIKQLFNASPIFADKTEDLAISASQSSQFTDWHNAFLNKLKTVIVLCEELGYEDGVTGFEVKLPETSSLKEFSGNIDSLTKIIQMCPFIREEDSEIELVKTDIGSTWFEFAIHGGQAVAILTALGYVAQSAMKIRSMYLSCEQQKQAVRAAKTKNDLAEKITETLKQTIEIVSFAEVEEIESLTGKALEAEEKNNAAKSIDLLGNLMSKGLEIYATLDAPAEAKDVFPTVNAQKIPSETQRLSGENNKE